MAVTKIWAIHDSVSRVVDYCSNPEKTRLTDLEQVLIYAANKAKTLDEGEQSYAVTGVNCRTETAAQEMSATQRRFGKTGGNVAYHAYQSFKTGEVSAAECHRIGLETARQLIACKPDGVRIYPTVIVRDTALCRMWERGEYREHTVEDAVRVCARLLPLFEEAGIPVIRLGLNPTDELSGGAAVAGAYHPALGELVKSRVLRNRAEALLRGIEPGSRVVLHVGRGKASQMTGQRRENIEWLRERFALSALRVRESPERASKNNEILSLSVEK